MDQAVFRRSGLYVGTVCWMINQLRKESEGGWSNLHNCLVFMATLCLVEERRGGARRRLPTTLIWPVLLFCQVQLKV